MCNRVHNTVHITHVYYDDMKSTDEVVTSLDSVLWGRPLVRRSYARDKYLVSGGAMFLSIAEMCARKDAFRLRKHDVHAALTYYMSVSCC